MATSDYSELPAIGAAIDNSSKSYDRIYGMLLGIRLHVSRISAKEMEDVNAKSFHEYEKIDIPREGNQICPGHKGNYDYKFKTYQPKVFRKLRHYFGVSDEEYLVSLTSDYMMSELKTIGRSSAMFYYTWDGRYVIKTQTKEEMKVLQKILPQYYEHVTNHPDTLVNQFYGAYRSQTSIGRKIHFVVMNNIFPIGYPIYYKFDLKGSVVNRSVDEAKRNHPGSTWKEAEFQEKRYMQVGPHDWPLLKAQLQDDTTFLSNAGVMDYSILIGIHKIGQSSSIAKPAQGERVELWTVFIPDKSSYFQYDGNSVIVRKREEEDGKRAKRHETEPTAKDVMSAKDRVIQQSTILPVQSSESAKLLSFCGGLRATNEEDEPLPEVYFLGIIDFLQDYNTRKSAEHLLKSFVYKKDEMSCIPPKRYANRMYDFLCKTIEPKNPVTLSNEMLRRRTVLQKMATIKTTRASIAPIKPELYDAPDKKKHHKHHHKKEDLNAQTLRPMPKNLIDSLIKETNEEAEKKAEEEKQAENEEKAVEEKKEDEKPKETVTEEENTKKPNENEN